MADDAGDAGGICCRRISTCSSASWLKRGLAIIDLWPPRKIRAWTTHVAWTVRQGGIYHEVLEQAKAIGADLI